jgi:hypothetical protein
VSSRATVWLALDNASDEAVETGQTVDLLDDGTIRAWTVIGGEVGAAEKSGRLDKDRDGEIISEKRPFAARRVDKSESKEFMDGIKESGFKALFPLLYATATPIKGFALFNGHRLRSMLTQECHANEWPELVAFVKFTERWDYDPVSQTRVYRPFEIGNAKSCWSSIMARAKYDLSRVVTSTTTELIGDTTPKFSPASTPRKPV